MDISKNELMEAKRQIDSTLHKLRETIKEKYNAIIEKEGDQKVFWDFGVTKESCQVQSLFWQF